jgi:CheY-like chemotaxis protein
MQLPKNIRVLLVEDNMINQKVIIVTLEKAQWQVTVVEDGREAVHRYNQGEYDVILMDFELPEVGGLSATKGIREIEKRLGKRRCPIIGISLAKSKEMQQKSLLIGMDDFLQKPFQPDELLAKIAQWTMPQAHYKAASSK